MNTLQRTQIHKMTADTVRILKALKDLKERLSDGNYAKVRNRLIRYLDMARSIENNPHKNFFKDVLFKKFYDDLEKPEYALDTICIDDIVSYARNVLTTFHKEGPKKEYYTFLTENPKKLQTINTNKKYP
jgi:hypothetical protein